MYILFPAFSDLSGKSNVPLVPEENHLVFEAVYLHVKINHNDRIHYIYVYIYQ